MAGLQSWQWFYRGLGEASLRAEANSQRDRLERARTLLHDSYAQPLQLEQIAKAAAFSRYHFVREFRREFDLTPRQYLTRCRLAEAKRMLQSSDASVTEICFAIGFASLGSFSTLFQRHEGCPPSAYRRRWVQSLGMPTPLPRIPGCFMARFAPQSLSR